MLPKYTSYYDESKRKKRQYCVPQARASVEEGIWSIKTSTLTVFLLTENTWYYRNTTNLFPHFKVHNAFYLLMQHLFSLDIATKNSRARYSPKNSRVLETAISHRHETRLLYNTGPQASATTTISKRHQAFLQLLNIVLHLGVNNQNTFFNLCKETTATRESQGNIWLSLVIL